MSNQSKEKSGHVCVYRGGDTTTPYLIHHWLMRNDIQSVVFGDLAGCGGEIPIPDALPSVWVPKKDSPRAITLVIEFESMPTDGEDWNCAHCKEQNPSHFGSCWQCGRDHPDLISEPHEAH